MVNFFTDTGPRNPLTWDSHHLDSAAEFATVVSGLIFSGLSARISLEQMAGQCVHMHLIRAIGDTDGAGVTPGPGKEGVL